MDGEDQPAASQMSEMDTPLNHAQEEAMPLVEWALTPMGHCNPKKEYANVIAFTNHLEIICFVTRATFSMVTEANKMLFWLSVRGRMLNVYSQGPDRAEQGLLAALGGRNAESVMTWALNGVESTLGT